VCVCVFVCVDINSYSESQIGCIYIYIYIYVNTVRMTTVIQIFGHDTHFMRKYIIYPGLIGGHSETKNNKWTL